MTLVYVKYIMCPPPQQNKNNHVLFVHSTWHLEVWMELYSQYYSHEPRSSHTINMKRYSYMYYSLRILFIARLSLTIPTLFTILLLFIIRVGTQPCSWIMLWDKIDGDPTQRERQLSMILSYTTILDVDSTVQESNMKPKGWDAWLLTWTSIDCLKLIQANMFLWFLDHQIAAGILRRGCTFNKKNVTCVCRLQISLSL